MQPAAPPAAAATAAPAIEKTKPSRGLAASAAYACRTASKRTSLSSAGIHVAAHHRGPARDAFLQPTRSLVMQQEYRSPHESSEAGRRNPAQISALGLRTFGQLVDMNVSVARVLLHTQARAASAFGLPDWSGWIDRVDGRTRLLFTEGADHLVNSAQRAGDAASQ